MSLEKFTDRSELFAWWSDSHSENFVMTVVITSLHFHGVKTLR